MILFYLNSLKYFQESFEAVHFGKYPVVSLKSLTTLITSGITPKSGGDAYVDNRLNGIPFIRSGNINIDGELDFNDLLYIKSDIHNTIMKSSQVRKNDLMIAIVGATIGQVGIYVFDNEANINQAIALVRLKDGISVEYVKELIKSSIGQLSLNRLKRPVARATSKSSSSRRQSYFGGCKTQSGTNDYRRIDMNKQQIQIIQKACEVCDGIAASIRRRTKGEYFCNNYCPGEDILIECEVL